MDRNQVTAASRWLFVLVIAALAVAAFGPAGAAGVARAQAQVELPRFEPAGCMFDAPAGYVEGENLDCGYLVVPLRHEAPEGPTIRLGVAILRSGDPNPAPDPLVMLQGGPGGSGIEAYRQLLPPSGLLADRDIILLDQRGTLYSEPGLACPEYLELTIETLDQDLPDEEMDRRALQAMQDCRDRLVEQEGVDLSAFDSYQNAADVAALYRVLGYEQYNLYGVSYGTLLALHVMRFQPQGLRSVILDAVVPPQTNFLLGVARTQNRAFEALFDACAADTECSRTFPNLREVFYQTTDRLNEDPVRVPVTDHETLQSYTALIDGDTFISLVFNMLYITDLIPLIPRVIYDARAGSFDFIARIYGLVIFDRSMSYGMYYSVLCAEDADFDLDEYDLADLPDQIVMMEADSPDFFLRTCQLWDVEALGAEMDEPVTSDIPTLLLSGHFDPITPPEYAEEAAQTLSNGYHYVVPWGGHGAATSGECQDNLILAFLRDPSAPPEAAAACLAAQSGPEFATPGSLVHLPVLSRLINLEEGTGWQALVYFLSLLFLLSALVIYPLVWFARLVSRGSRPQPQPAYGTVTAGSLENESAGPDLYRFAPWLASLTALALLAFTAVFLGVLVNMVTANDWRVLMGLPGSARPLFLLPPFAALLAVIMLFTALIAWGRGSGSVWGRLYLTLLTLAAGACLVVLALWGMLTAVFGG